MLLATTRVLLASVILLLSCTLCACRGKDLDFDCDYQFAQFQAASEGNGDLRPDVPEDGPYPVSVLLSEEGLGRILNTAVGNNIPFAGDLPLGGLTLMFEPTGTPQVRIEDVPGCVDCVLLDVDFFLSLADGQGAVSSGAGTTRLGIPMLLAPADDDSADLIADYDNLRIVDLTFTVAGFDSVEHDALAGAMRTLIEEKLREIYDPTPLFAFQPWRLGEGAIRLLARRLFFFPGPRLLAIAMQTNLQLPEGAGLERPTLPTDAHLGVRFHDAIFLPIARRLMAEGVIASRYDFEGQAAPDGDFGVTLQSIHGTEDLAADSFDVVFRVWKIAGTYCGYAEILMDMRGEWEGRALRLTPGQPSVLFGKGSGSVAAMDDQLVEDNLDLIDEFKTSLAQQLALTIGLNTIELDAYQIVVEDPRLRMNPVGVFLDMDFFMVEKP